MWRDLVRNGKCRITSASSGPCRPGGLPIEQILADQGRRAIKDAPDRAEAAKAEATKLGIQVKDMFYTPGGPHDAAMLIEAEGPEPINKFMASVQSLGNVKLKFIQGFLNRGDAQDSLMAN